VPKTAESRTIADRYKLIRPLGRGGMGVVWLAEDTLLKRRVAVKEIEFPPELEPEDTASVKARALREARSAASLNHPRVVTIFDVLHEEDGAFIVMEYVDATTLSELVKKGGPLPVDRVARIGVEVLEALEVAHARGIVHRDVKPGNIMIAEDGAKLADFGIASVKDDPKITSTGMVLGSPQFMAPEQARGTGSDPRTDLWSLGATLYLAVEGELPFDRGQPIATLSAVINENPNPMRSAGSLTPVISALLSKEPEARPAGDELRAMLEDAAAGPSSRPVVGAAPDEALHPSVQHEVPTPAPTPRAEPAPARDRRGGPGWRSLVVAALIAGLLAFVAGVAIVTWLNADDAPDTAPTQDRPRRTEERDTSGPGGGNGNEEDNGSGNATAQTGLPSGWTRYVDEESGFEIAFPAEWAIIQDSSDSDSTDFRDETTGTYLRVDWTESPGDDPVEAWENQAQSFAASHSNYEEIQISPTTFKGYDAAIWEFTYSEGGANLHALDLGFVTDNMGFALFFQTHATSWDASQDLFQQLQESFQAPPGE
jgi:eukaryotic-like serine/threonine-protein kinase